MPSQNSVLSLLMRNRTGELIARNECHAESSHLLFGTWRGSPRGKLVGDRGRPRLARQPVRGQVTLSGIWALWPQRQQRANHRCGTRLCPEVRCREPQCSHFKAIFVKRRSDIEWQLLGPPRQAGAMLPTPNRGRARRFRFSRYRRGTSRGGRGPHK